jgi:hypothetical protein
MGREVRTATSSIAVTIYVETIRRLVPLMDLMKPKKMLGRKAR